MAELDGVAASDVLVTVTAASVKISIEISMSGSEQAAAAAAVLSPKMSDEAAASDPVFTEASRILDSTDPLVVEFARRSLEDLLPRD